MSGRTGDLNVGVLLAPGAYTTTQNPNGIDLQGEINPGGDAMLAVLNVGALSGTAVSVAVKLQDSNTSTGATDFTDISGGAFTTLSSTASTGVKTLPIVTNKRYVRAVVTYGTQMTSASLGVELIGNNAIV